MFKLDHLDDPEGAIAELAFALQGDPESLDCKLEMTRALQRNMDFEGSRRLLNDLLEDQARLPQLKVRMLYDLELQHWSRLADKLVSEGDHERAARALLSLARAFHNCPGKLRDEKIRGRLPQALPTARRILKYCYVEEVRRRIVAFITWVESGQWTDSAAPNESGVGARGTIVKLVTDRGYGFLRLRDGDEIFFHFSDLEFPEAELEVGGAVTCDLGKGRDGAARAFHVARGAGATTVTA
jgi:cold shock CspA family protein